MTRQPANLPEINDSADSPSAVGNSASLAAKRAAAALCVVTAAVFLAAAIPAPIRAAWDEFSFRMQLQSGASSTTQSSSPSKLSDHEIDEIAEMAPQQKAERLLERAVNHYDGALDLINKSLDSWYGQLELQGQLTTLLTTALNSNDLQVRAAALEIELAVYNLPKRPESADSLI